MIKTKVLSTKDPKSISSAQSTLSNHGTVAFPTDTIYGIAANAFSPNGINRLYWAKKRPPDKALPILIGDLSQLSLLVPTISKHVERIIHAFWPGPLTLVLPKGPNIPPELSALPTIGIRMPDFAFTLQLLKQTGPLATTSANISGGLNPVTAQDVLDQLDGRVDLILDSGPTPGPMASTVLDASSANLNILREGPISLDELNQI